MRDLSQVNTERPPYPCGSINGSTPDEAKRTGRWQRSAGPAPPSIPKAVVVPRHDSVVVVRSHVPGQSAPHVEHDLLWLFDQLIVRDLQDPPAERTQPTARPEITPPPPGVRMKSFTVGHQRDPWTIANIDSWIRKNS